jgi:hypothetical protein
MTLSIRLLIGILVCCSAFAQENILPDPNFEAPDTHGQLTDGWWVYNNRGEAHAVIDKKIAHSGKQSVRLTSTPDPRFVFVSPKLPITSQDEVAFSGWIRFDTPQETNHACINVTFRDKENRIVDRVRALPQRITPGEWIFLNGTATAPARSICADFEVQCSNLVGSVWADDVTAIVTSPQSMYLDQVPKAWPGQHELLVRIINRERTPYHGTIRAETGGKTVDVPAIVPPSSAQKFKVNIDLPRPGRHEYSLALLDAAGKPQRNIEGVFRINEPLAVFPACPSYVNIGSGSATVRVDSRVIVNPSKRSGLHMVATLYEASGKQIAQKSADASRGEFVGTKLRVPTSTASVYGIDVRLIDRSGAEIARGETDVHVHDPAESIVKTQPNGFLRVAGQPEFPIGLYSTSQYEHVSEGGFNATHTYSITTGDAQDPINANDIDLKRLLDSNVKYHLRMMVELPRHAIEHAQWDQVRRRIETFRNHPGLLCWGSEERVARGEAPLKNIVALYKLVHQLDPNHPLVLGDTRDVIQHLMVDRRNFFPDQAMDAGIWWWYPIPLDGADGEPLDGHDQPAKMLEPPSWLTTTTSKKPLWIAIQSYQHPKKDAPFPTPAQYRCMAYLSIINNAHGLWFYTGSGQRDFYGRPAGILNKPEEGHWDYVKQLVHELREISPVIMSPSASGIKLAKANPAIDFSVHEHENKFYIFAANKSPQPQTATFAGDVLRGKHVRVLYETHVAANNGQELTDSFEPFGVHVYCVE